VRSHSKNAAAALGAAAERSVLADIARVGYEHRPHIVNALRCFTADRLATKNDGLFPVLWSARFYRFCAEAFPTLDQNRSVYMPYCPRSPALEPPASLGHDRPIRVLFVGSVPKRRVSGTRARRQATVAALRRLDGATVEVHASHGGDLSERAIRLMRSAVYTPIRRHAREPSHLPGDLRRLCAARGGRLSEAGTRSMGRLQRAHPESVLVRMLVRQRYLPPAAYQGAGYAARGCETARTDV
jgi:hypothetical protein